MQCRDDVQKTRCLRDLEAVNIEWLRLLGNTHKECMQAMWNADVSTARILLETKRKATK